MVNYGILPRNIEEIDKNDLAIYKLYAVIVHEGNIDGGHYYALCKVSE
jgi:ubiquitin C-terminal hydrolase